MIRVILRAGLVEVEVQAETTLEVLMVLGDAVERALIARDCKALGADPEGEE